jgi:hypothetical protein
MQISQQLLTITKKTAFTTGNMFGLKARFDITITQPLQPNTNGEEM